MVCVFDDTLYSQIFKWTGVEIRQNFLVVHRTNYICGQLVFRWFCQCWDFPSTLNQQYMAWTWWPSGPYSVRFRWSCSFSGGPLVILTPDGITPYIFVLNYAQKWSSNRRIRLNRWNIETVAGQHEGHQQIILGSELLGDVHQDNDNYSLWLTQSNKPSLKN